MGMCYEEVLVEVADDNGSYLYSRVTPDKAKRIVREHVVAGQPVEEWVIKGNGAGSGDGFFDKQKRIVLRNCGVTPGPSP